MGIIWIWGGRAARHYAADPMGGDAANLSAEEKARVLGGESCMWSEYVNAENIDSRIWPRNAAIAERLWSPQEVRDPASMYARMHAVSAELEWVGLTHRSYYLPALHRIAGAGELPRIQRAEKSGGCGRAGEGVYPRGSSSDPCPERYSAERVVDAIALESRVGQEFGEMVDKFVTANCHDAALAAQLRGQLILWRDNDAKLQPLMQRSFLVKETAATSQDLSAVAGAGLAAMDALEKSGGADESWKAQQIAVLQQAQKPKGQLLLMPAPAIQKLVEAAANGGACISVKQ